MISDLVLDKIFFLYRRIGIFLEEFVLHIDLLLNPCRKTNLFICIDVLETIDDRQAGDGIDDEVFQVVFDVVFLLSEVVQEDGVV